MLGATSALAGDHKAAVAQWRNLEAHRRTQALGREVAFADYRLQDGVVCFTHTEVQPRHEGQGVGSRLAAAALDDVKKRGLQVEPACAHQVGHTVDVRLQAVEVDDERRRLDVHDGSPYGRLLGVSHGGVSLSIVFFGDLPAAGRP